MPNELITIKQFIAELRKVAHDVAVAEGLNEEQEAKLLLYSACAIGNMPMEMGGVSALDK